MSIFLDIILAFILAVCIFVGYKHGLIRTLSKFLSYLISFTLANNLYVLIAKLIVKLSFFKTLLHEEPFSEKMTFLDRFSLSFDQIKENLFVLGDEAVMKAAEETVDNAIAIMISSALAFVLSFIIALLLMKLVLWLLNDLITKIPVLKQINGILGGLFGLLNGFFWTCCIAHVFVQFLLPILMEKWPTVFVNELSQSLIIQLCTTINPITYLIAFINFIFH